MNNQDDLFCASAPYDVNFFPSVTSRANFTIESFAAQLSALEEVGTDEPIVLLEAPMPAISAVQEAEIAVFKTLGESRFSGNDAYTFLHMRFKAIDATDMFQGATSSIEVTACDSEGYPYTYTILNSAYTFDQDAQQITYPVFDFYGQMVSFPLYDLEGKFLLTTALTAIDETKQTIHFPLKDAKGIKLKYPFKLKSGETIVVPRAYNTEKIYNVNDAYEALDGAYDNAKDADAYKFVQYILNLEKTNKISFFIASETVAGTQDVNYCAVSVYDITASDDDLNDITSSKSLYFVRYYPDRAEYAYALYKELGGAGPYVKIDKDSTSTVNAELLSADNKRLTSHSILAASFWSKDAPESTYQNNVLKSSRLHNNMIDLYSLVDELSAKLTALTTLVNFNTTVIDTLTTQTNWPAIWNTPAGFTAPVRPTRPT